MLTTYYKNLLADHIWHTAAEAELPETYYITFSSTEPQEDGTGVTEPDASSGFARVALTGLTDAVDGEVFNGANLEWAELISDQGAISYWALFDAPTGGHLLMSEPLPAVKHMDAGTAMVMKPSKLSLKVLGA